MSSPVKVVLERNMRKALASRQLEKAEDLLLRLKEEAPMDRNTRGFELELLIEAGRDQEARALADQLTDAFPDSSRILFLAGTLAYRLKNYKRAEFCFRESDRLYSHWRSRYWLGRTLTQVGAFDEALNHLEEAVTHTHHANRDLAWFHERKGNPERALNCYRQLLEKEQDSEYYKSQVVRLEARMLDPEELVEEVSSLADLGEEIPPELFPEYIEKLFQTGQGDKARVALTEEADRLIAGNGIKIGWACYRAGAYDLAFELFLRFFHHSRSSYKFMNSLESAARKCNRVPDLMNHYEELAPRDKSLYGRLKKLQK